jgi:hypothetical protein
MQSQLKAKIKAKSTTEHRAVWSIYELHPVSTVAPQTWSARLALSGLRLQCLAFNCFGDRTYPGDRSCLSLASACKIHGEFRGQQLGRPDSGGERETDEGGHEGGEA